MKTLRHICLSLVFLTMLSTITWGQVVTFPYYNSFNYSAGTTLGVTPNWSSLNTGDSVFVTAGNLTYSGFSASSGNKIAFDGAGSDPVVTFPTLTTGKIYASFLLRISSLGSMTTAGGYIATFYQSPTSITGGTLLYLRKDADGTSYDIGVASRVGTTVNWGTARTVGSTYLIVMDYEVVSGSQNDISNLWINPDASTFGAITPPAATLSTTNTTLADLTGMARLTLRQDASTTTPFVEIDEFRLDTTWTNVTPFFRATNYYSKSTGNLNDLATWGQSPDGSGSNPPDFTSDGQIFNIRNNATPTIGGNWFVSGSTSNVIVGNGTAACTFTIPSAYTLTGPIDVSANATLKLQNTTLPTIGTLASTSTVDYAASSAQTLRSLNYGNLKISNTAGVSIAGSFGVAGNLTVNGTLTQSTGTTTFNGTASQTISGSATAALYAVTINCGSSQSTIVEAQSVISIGSTLTITNGVLKISSASTFSLPTWTSVPVTAGFWLNNSSASVTIGSGNTTFNGLFRLTSGTFNTGSAADQNINCNTTSTFIIEGGNLNIAGRVTRATSPSGSYTQTGGTVTVAMVGSTSTSSGCFYFGSAGSAFTMSGGTIIIQQPNRNFSSDYTLLSGGTSSVTGGTVQLGNSNTPAADSFRVSSSSVPIYNLVIDGTTTTKYVKTNFDLTISNSLTINGGSTFDLDNNVITFSGATFTNNGVLIGSLLTNSSSRFNFSGASVAQTYQGTGTVGTLADPLAGMGFSNANGVTINSSVTNLNVNRLNLFTGTVTNSNKFTLGNSSGLTSYILIGSTASAVGTAGTFDVAPNFSLSSAGLTLYYGNATNAPSTGVEIPPSRTLTGLTVNNTGGGFTIAGGSLTVSSSLTLTNGLMNLGSNDLILGSALTVSGTPSATNMIVATGSGEVKKSIAAVPAQFTFPVGDNTGTAEYSPVNVTLSSGTLSSAWIGVKLSNAKHGSNSSATDYLNRSWTLTANGITSPVHTDTLKYVAADVVGTESSLVGGLYTGSWTALGAVDVTNHEIVATGLTTFGDITAGEAGAFASAGIVHVTVIPQGYYNAGDYLNSTDVISVCLADANTPYGTIDSVETTLDSLTFIGSATFNTAATGSYYLVVKQRSSVETWSTSPVAFAKGSTIAYDFTNAQNKAYGDNQIQVSSSPERWAIYGGDCNQDGYVDPLDMSLIDQDSFNYVSGNGLATDVNGDHFVDPLDMSIADQNSFNYIGIKRPVASKTIHTRSRAPQGIHYQDYLKSLKK